jgi:hypothetical protein
MLDLCNSRELIESLWHSLDLRAELPCSKQEYWDHTGPMRVQYDSERRYHRYYLREIGVVQHSGQNLAVYTKDVSRIGVGFFSPIQLFPCDRVELQLPGKNTLSLEIARCLRIRDRCFECGTVYSSDPHGEGHSRKQFDGGRTCR